MSKEGIQPSETTVDTNFFMLKKVTLSMHMHRPSEHFLKNAVRNAPSGIEINIMGVPGTGKTTFLRQALAYCNQYGIQTEVVDYDSSYYAVSQKYGHPQLLEPEQYNEVIKDMYQRRDSIRQVKARTSRLFIFTERPGVGVVNRGQFPIEEEEQYLDKRFNDLLFIIISTRDRLESSQEFRGFILGLQPEYYSYLPHIIFYKYGYTIPELEATFESGTNYVERIRKEASPQEIIRIARDQYRVQETDFTAGFDAERIARQGKLFKVKQRLEKILPASALYDINYDSIPHQLLYWQEWANRQQRFNKASVYRVLNI